MSTACNSAVQQGISAVAFGDLFLEDVRRYREDRLRGTGLEPLFPIWGRDTRQLILEMLDAGLRARIICADPSKLVGDFIGCDLNHDLLGRLPTGVDPCGENGEFHTFTHAGPMFSQPIPIKGGETVTRDGFLFADVLPDSDMAVTNPDR
jgi:diphthamide synthase (EF-2-diphthine--ammonia ligase)